jgi:hypothetical protein
MKELKRLVCANEDCNKSFYVFYADEIVCCPFCKSEDFYDYDTQNRLEYWIDCRDKINFDPGISPKD